MNFDHRDGYPDATAKLVPTTRAVGMMMAMDHTPAQQGGHGQQSGQYCQSYCFHDAVDSLSVASPVPVAVNRSTHGN